MLRGRLVDEDYDFWRCELVKELFVLIELCDKEEMERWFG